MVITFCGTIILSDGKEIIDTTFKGYTNWPGVLQAVAIFVFFKYKNYDSKLLNSKLFLRTIKKFADVTFGVYLVHYYFVMILYRFSGDRIFSIFWRFAGAIVVFICSSTLILILKKIPLVKHIVP